MKAPKFHHRDILQAALAAAVDVLDDPVEGLMLTHDGVIAWSKTRGIVLEVFSTGSARADDGGVVLGGGGMAARYLRDCARPKLT